MARRLREAPTSEPSDEALGNTEISENARKTPVSSLSTTWITEALVVKTSQVWSDYLGRPISRSEAVEMLMRVRDLAMLVSAADEETEELP